MNRAAALYEITGVMGDALAALEGDGIALDDRTVRLFVDRFCDQWKALPEQDVTKQVRALIKLVNGDEKLHGGVLGRETIRTANALGLELDRVPGLIDGEMAGV